MCVNTRRLISGLSERLDRRGGGPEAAGGGHHAESAAPGPLHAAGPGLPAGAGFPHPDVSTQTSRGEAPTPARFCPSGWISG